jgi:hypothetical protein
MGSLLGDHSPCNSWVVNAERELPTKYLPENVHPDVLRTSIIISTADALGRGLQQWRLSGGGAAATTGGTQ